MGPSLPKVWFSYKVSGNQLIVIWKLWPTKSRNILVCNLWFIYRKMHWEVAASTFQWFGKPIWLRWAKLRILNAVAVNQVAVSRNLKRLNSRQSSEGSFGGKETSKFYLKNEVHAMCRGLKTSGSFTSDSVFASFLLLFEIQRRQKWVEIIHSFLFVIVLLGLFE